MTEVAAVDETPRCPLCHRPQAIWAVCVRCVERVDKQLEEILDLVARAGYVENLAPGRSGDAGHGPRREPPAPLRIDVLDLDCGYDVLTALEAWERDWRHSFGLVPYGDASESRLQGSRSHETVERVTLVGVVGFLRSWGPTAATRHPGFDEYAHDVAHVLRRAQSILGLLEDTGRVTCPCGARITLQDDLQCPRCGTEWNLARLLAVSSGPVWVNATTAVYILGDRFGPMVRDGRIRKKGAGPDAVYDINSAREVAG